MKKDFTFEWLKHYTETMYKQILKERKRIENENEKTALRATSEDTRGSHN